MELLQECYNMEEKEWWNENETWKIEGRILR